MLIEGLKKHKLMKAPEKIYLLPRQGGDYAPYWKTDSRDGFGIEYVQTDSFIEKAERYIRNIADGLDRDDDVEAFINEFKKYMNGG